MRHFLTILMGVAMSSAAPGQSPGEVKMTVRLLSPISTANSVKGDTLTAQVIEPPALAGDILEGKITESKGGHKIKGKSTLTFTFDTLNHAGTRIPIQSSVESLANSKGQLNVDEEGRVIRKSNNLGKAAAATAIGALIGGLAGGGKGAAIGAGVGAAASLLFIKFAAEGPAISFAPGSSFVLSVRERGGR